MNTSIEAPEEQQQQQQQEQEEVSSQQQEQEQYEQEVHIESRKFSIAPVRKGYSPLTEKHNKLLMLIESIKQKSFTINTQTLQPSEYAEYHNEFTSLLNEFSSNITEYEEQNSLSIKYIYQIVYTIRNAFPKVYLLTLVVSNPHFAKYNTNYVSFFKTQEYFFQQITNPICEYYARVYCYEHCHGIFEKCKNDFINNFRVSNILRLNFLYTETMKSCNQNKEVNTSDEMKSIIQPLIDETKSVLGFNYASESYRDKIIKQLLQVILSDDKLYNESLMDLILNHLPPKSFFANIYDIIIKVDECYDYDINMLSKLITAIEKLLTSSEYLSTNDKHVLISVDTFNKVFAIMKNIFYKVKEIDFKDELGLMLSFLLVFTQFVQGFKNPLEMVSNYTDIIQLCETYSQLAIKSEEVKDKEKTRSNSIVRRDRGESIKTAATMTSTSSSKSKSQSPTQVYYTSQHVDIIWKICDIIFAEDKVSIFQLQRVTNLINYCDKNYFKVKYFKLLQYLNNNEKDYVNNEEKIVYLTKIIRNYVSYESEEIEKEYVIKKEIEYREINNALYKIFDKNLDLNLKLLIIYKNIYHQDDSNYIYLITLQIFLLRILSFISDIEHAYSYKIGLLSNEEKEKTNITILPFDLDNYNDDSLYEFINGILLIFHGYIYEEYVNFAEITSVCLVKAVGMLDMFRFKKDDFEVKCFEFLESFKQLIEDEICDQEVKLRFAKEFILTLCNINILTFEHYITMANYVSNEFKKKFIKREGVASVLLFSTELFYRKNKYNFVNSDIIEKNICLAEKEALYILSQKKEMQLFVDILQKRMYFINEGVLPKKGLCELKEKIKEMSEENSQMMILNLIDNYIAELDKEEK